jgi:dihydroorotate dehydrogenase electron transfer subunit
MKALQSKVKILDNLKLCDGYFRLKFSSRRIARAALPGQFVMLRINDGTVPLLRRPLGVHNVKGGQGVVELLYEVVGKGTELLSRKQPGEYIDIIGPLGNGFTLRPPALERTTPILVAGGMGVAPLVFLAEKLKVNKCLVLIGARTKEQLICANDFKRLGCKVKLATDNGSAGFKGRVTDLLKKELAALGCRGSTIYSCGPEPMLKAVSRLAKNYNIPAQLSLEAHMSCGFGACLGCVVNTLGGYKRVCKEGPVFNANDIIWE